MRRGNRFTRTLNSIHRHPVTEAEQHQRQSQNGGRAREKSWNENGVVGTAPLAASVADCNITQK
ncbi:unnamed protein product, partial [Nesidiocoris tenuis]